MESIHKEMRETLRGSGGVLTPFTTPKSSDREGSGADELSAGKRHELSWTSNLGNDGEWYAPPLTFTSDHREGVRITFSKETWDILEQEKEKRRISLATLRVKPPTTDEVEHVVSWHGASRMTLPEAYKKFRSKELTFKFKSPNEVPATYLAKVTLLPVGIGDVTDHIDIEIPELYPASLAASFLKRREEEKEKEEQGKKDAEEKKKEERLKKGLGESQSLPLRDTLGSHITTAKV